MTQPELADTREQAQSKVEAQALASLESEVAELTSRLRTEGAAAYNKRVGDAAEAMAANAALRMRLDGCNVCIEIVLSKFDKTRWWEWRKRRDLISLEGELQEAKDELRAREAGR